MIEPPLVIGHVIFSTTKYNPWLVLFMVPFLQKTLKRHLHCHLKAVPAFCKIWKEKLPQRFLSKIIKCSHAAATKRSLWHQFYNWFLLCLEKYVKRKTTWKSIFCNYNTSWSVIHASSHLIQKDFWLCHSGFFPDLEVVNSSDFAI